MFKCIWNSKDYLHGTNLREVVTSYLTNLALYSYIVNTLGSRTDTYLYFIEYLPNRLLMT